MSFMSFGDLRAELVRRTTFLGGEVVEAVLSLFDGDETYGLQAITTDPEGLACLRSTLALWWHSAFAPEAEAGTDRWVRAFRHVGFVTDDEECEAPTESMVVYRGATEANARRMAWTTDVQVAEGHVLADQNGLLIEPGRLVWRSVAPPEAVLAMIFDRDENEVVVDPTMLLELTRLADAKGDGGVIGATMGIYYAGKAEVLGPGFGDEPSYGSPHTLYRFDTDERRAWRYVPENDDWVADDDEYETWELYAEGFVELDEDEAEGVRLHLRVTEELRRHSAP